MRQLCGNHYWLCFNQVLILDKPTIITSNLETTSHAIQLTLLCYLRQLIGRTIPSAMFSLFNILLSDIIDQDMDIHKRKYDLNVKLVSLHLFMSTNKCNTINSLGSNGKSPQ